jgi:hypothetical protein
MELVGENEKPSLAGKNRIARHHRDGVAALLQGLLRVNTTTPSAATSRRQGSQGT